MSDTVRWADAGTGTVHRARGRPGTEQLTLCRMLTARVTMLDTDKSARLVGDRECRSCKSTHERETP